MNTKILTNFKGDLFGGLTAGIIALPLALAFGVASGLGATAGLYGAILVCMFATIFGGTPTQISGPTGPMTVVVASIVATNPGNYRLIFMTIFIAGIFQILLGISKVGKLIHYVPYPVISGFMTGIGAIIILLQVNPLLGLKGQGDTIHSVIYLFQSIQNMNVHAAFLGILTLLIVFLTPKKINKKVPSALIALIVVTLISVGCGFDVPTIGEIPVKLPKIQLGMISLIELRHIIPISLTLAILGSIDSLLTSLVADSVTKTRHNSSKELIGQGVGNMVASIFGGLAGAGATMRTVVNVKAGGRTRISGVVHSIFLILVLICLAPIAAQIPLTVLAGILIKVGFDIIDYKLLKIIPATPKSDITVMTFVLLITVFGDLIFAVGVGIVLSAILFAGRVAQHMDVDVKEISCEENAPIIDECQYQIMMVKVNGIFFFGSATQVIDTINESLETQCLIINCKTIKTLDISAFFALEEILLKLKDNHVKPYLVLRDSTIMRKLMKAGILNILSREDITYTEEKAIKKARDYVN